MVVKLTQEQADYLETFDRYDKNKAFYFISSWGWGNSLRDGLGEIYDNDENNPFDFDEKEKMLNALINGYEIYVPKYKFHIFSDINGFKELYYAGKDVQLTNNEEEAKNIVKNSDEYLALENLGFIKEEV